MTKNFKKMLSILMALTMILGLTPSRAQAADGAAEEPQAAPAAETVLPQIGVELPGDPINSVFPEVPRLEVVFHQYAEGETSDPSESTSIFLKAGDDVEALVYDPGAGTLPTNGKFLGWTTSPSFTEETVPMTIDEVREAVETKLGSFSDGDKLEYYPVVFRIFNITFKDENGIVIDTVRLKLDLSATNSDYTISMPYTPEDNEHAFMGWNVADGASSFTVVSGSTEAPYENGTKINVTGDVTFSVNAPFGHWLVFDQAKGATYYAPQFVKVDDVTRNPGTPERFGYTFGGWYSDEACTQSFTFGQALTETTTVYAKWTENTTADYTVIIWKQDVDGENYDFAEAITLSGNVSATITSVTATGSGDGRYASVNGTAKRYTGFHLKEYDSGKTISTQGNTVVNVYYDRNEVTLTFQIRQNNRWQTIETMTGLYGQTLASQGYTWPSTYNGTSYWWYDDYESGWGGYSGSGTRTTFLDAFILSDGSSSQTFYGFTGDGRRTVHFLQQNASGSGYTEVETVTTSNGTFNISDKFNGFKAVSYSTNNSSWTQLGNKDSNGYYAAVSNYTNLYIRYDRLLYSILFYDGVYVDGNNNTIDETNRGKLKTVSGIAYGSNVASYNKDGADFYAPTVDGYVFEGWYVDETCTQEYTFASMPEGITVYAKWRQIQYRVFLHPNVPASDTSLNWGSDSQAMNFRISFGGTISVPYGTRDEYDFVGWYLDEDFKEAFNEKTVLNESTVKTAYDKTKDMTDPMDKWGNGATSNADTDRPWITKKFELYARWRKVLDGADGIGIVYDANGGSNAPSDTSKYLDEADAVAGAASKAASADEQFQYWVLQKWNGSSYEDTDITLHPGDHFTVYADNAKKEADGTDDEGNAKYKYTIQLKAVYGPQKDDVDVVFDANGGTFGSSTKITQTIDINTAIEVPEDPTREGYIFVGWYGVKADTDEKVVLEAGETYYADQLADDKDAARFAWDGEKNLLKAIWVPIPEVVSGDKSWTYDGETHKYNQYNVVVGDQTEEGTENKTSFSFEYTTEADSKVTIEVTVTPTAEGVKNVADSKPENNTFTATAKVAGESVEPETTFGELAIEPAEITIKVTGHKVTEKFDNKEHSAEGYDLECDAEFFDESKVAYDGTAKVTKIDAGTYPMGLDKEKFSYDDENVIATFEVTDGELKITTAAIVVKITGNKDSLTYSGKEQKVEGYKAESDSDLFDESKVSYSGEAVAKGTDVDTYPMGLEESGFSYDDPNLEVEFEVTDGELEITPLAVTVTIIGNKDSLVYNGKEQKVEGYEAEADSDLYDVDKDMTFSGEAVAKGTDVDTYEMGLKEDQFKNTNDNFEVTFKVTDGELEITPLAVTVTITGNKDSLVYNGKEQKVEGYEAEADSDLYDVDKDMTFSGEAVAKGTDVDTYEMGLKEDQFENTNDNFEVTFKVTDGELEITPLAVKVTITGNNASDDYDGKEHTVEGYTAEADSDLYDVDKDIEFTGEAKASRTDKGITNMGLKVDQFKNTNDNFKVTFEIKEDGYQEILPIDVTVTIVGENSTDTYDGKEHTVEGYTATADSDLYDVEKDFTFSGSAKASRTDVGTTNMGLAEDQFENTNENFNVVAFKITDGYQTIEPLEVTVTITGNKDSLVYNGKEQKVEGYEAEADSELYDVDKDMSFSGEDTAKGTDVGTYEMGLKEDQFENTNDNFTVTFKVTDGELEITPLEVTVTVTGNKDSLVYNGKEQTVEGYEAEADSDLYDVDKDMSFSGEAAAKGTDVGTYEMGLAEDQFENTNDNFTVTFKVTDGELEITPLEITVTADDQTKVEEEEDPELTVTIEGLADGDDESLIEFTVSREEGEEPGDYVITPEGEEEQGNYKVTFVTGTLTITPIPTFDITFDPNGGTLVIDGEKYTTDSKYVITVREGTEIEIVDAPDRDGYTFTYWKGSEYQPGDKYTVTEDHTFTAQWEENELPKAGDDANLLLWASVLTLSAAGIGFTLFSKKRREDAE